MTQKEINKNLLPIRKGTLSIDVVPDRLEECLEFKVPHGIFKVYPRIKFWTLTDSYSNNEYHKAFFKMGQKNLYLSFEWGGTWTLIVQGIKSEYMKGDVFHCMAYTLWNHRKTIAREKTNAAAEKALLGL